MDEKKRHDPKEISKAQEIATIQRYIFNLNKENYASSLSYFSESPFITDSSYHEIFLRNILWAFQLRPKSIVKLFELFLWFSTQIEDNIFYSVLLSFFIRCHSNFESHSQFIYDFFCFIFQLLDNSFDFESIDEKYIKTFCEKLLNLNESENTKIQSELTFQKDDILSIIYRDDIQKFTELSSRPEFNINSTITIQNPILFSVKKDMSLFEVAACLGSVQIFKYIMINGGIIEKQGQFPKLAIQGGNSEIIRIVEQKGLPFNEEEIGEASYFHQIDILQWILDSHKIKDVTLAIKKSATSNFFDGILFFENNKDEYSNIFYNCPDLIEWAALSGSLDVLNFLLSNNSNQLNNTIFSVVTYGELTSANLLKDQFHSCINNCKSKRIKSRPIHIATHNKLNGHFVSDVFMCRFLIDNFPELDINAQDQYGSTVLHLSIRYNHLDTFKLFMANEKIDVNLCDYGDSSPLHEAICSDNIIFTKILLEDERTNINLVDQNGKTPIIEALDSDKAEYVKLFLNSNKPIDKFTDIVNESILKKTSSPDISNLLIYSDNFEINNPEVVQTVIDNIIQAQMYQLLELFIKQSRFNINLKFGEELKTVLHLCCSIKPLYHFIPLILERKDLDINLHDKNGLTPLHEAMRSQDNDYSVFLIRDPRIDINALDNGNQTALHYAASNWSRVPLTDLLLHPKINVNIIDKDGKTALFVACELGVVDNVEILLNDYKIDTEIEIESVFLRIFFFGVFY